MTIIVYERPAGPALQRVAVRLGEDHEPAARRENVSIGLWRLVVTQLRDLKAIE